MLGLDSEAGGGAREGGTPREGEVKGCPNLWLGTKGQWYHNHDNEPSAETGLDCRG